VSRPFQFTPRAAHDIDAIWSFIAQENEEAADRVGAEIISACFHLAKFPMIGGTRPDITELPLRFWTVTKFPNYVIVYRPNVVPLQVVAVLHGKQNLAKILAKRSR
jgi:plasmid stabilization system protein ParE